MKPGNALRQRIQEANPILIKDLRQSLRGRLFRGAFLITLLVATLVAATSIANVHEWNRNRAGADLFIALTFAFVLICFLVAPVLANRSMASERESSLLDALTLSGLTPARIVFGKFQASAVLTLLILAAFLPAFAVASTLYGLQLGLAAGVLLLSLLAGLALNMLGIWAACVARGLLASNVLLGVLIMALGAASAAWLGMLMALVFEMRMSGMMPLGALLTLLFSLGALALGGANWLYGLCAWLLSHPERPDVARARRAIILLAALAGLAAFLTLLQANAPSMPGLLAALLYFFFTFLMLPHLCERDDLQRGTALELSRGAQRQFLTMPGGGNATLLWLILLSFACFLTLLAPVRAATGDGIGENVDLAALAICLALGGLLPAAAGRSRAPRLRWVVLCYAALPALSLLHAVLGIFGGSPESTSYWSINPIGLLAMAGDGEPTQPGLALWCTLGATGLIAAIVRTIQARQRVLRARRPAAPA